MNNQTQKPILVTTENLISDFGSHFCVSTGRTGKMENLKVYQELGKTPSTNELDAYQA